MSNEVRELIKAIGGLAEFANILVSSLDQNGFSRAEAVSIAKEYLITMLTKKQNNQEETGNG